MAKIYAFFNPLAGNGGCKEDVTLLELLYDEQIIYCDMTLPETYETQLFALTPEDLLILCGGDGTVNRFVNLLQDLSIPCDILLFPLGNRNNFARLLGHRFGDGPFSIKNQLLRCPCITVNGQTRRFLWGVEFESATTRNHRATAHLGSIALPFRSLCLTAGQPLTLQRRKPHRRKADCIPCGNQAELRFDRPISLYIDGEVMKPAESCTVCMETR